MKWDVMDIMNMSYTNSQFDCVLDKGALDAIATEDSAATASSVRKMFGEIARVLKVGGRYVCISLAQEHVLGLALDFFVGDSWRIEAWRVPTEEHAGARANGEHGSLLVACLRRFDSVWKSLVSLCVCIREA